MDQIKIGQYIADKRKAQGLTQEQLAQKLSKSQKAVSKWERGVCLPDVSVYTELCDILGITLNEFFSGEDIGRKWRCNPKRICLALLLKVKSMRVLLH